jgi:F-type H+-transporting ATPase subunit delta
MAENVTIARPYAEAAFQLAKESGTLPAWENALSSMAAAAAEPSVRGVLTDPGRTSTDRGFLFLTVVPGELAEEHRSFARVLAENGRLGLLPEIQQMFTDLKNEHERTAIANISSAFPMDDATVARLMADLEPRFGCRLVPRVTLDPELIGGVTVAVGDEVIDASVRGKLAAMATALQN